VLSENEPPDDRSSLARAMVWSSRVTTISLEMAVPGLVGVWLDRRLGTGMLLVVVGVILGFALGMWHLIKLANPTNPPGHQKKPPEETK